MSLHPDGGAPKFSGLSWESAIQRLLARVDSAEIAVPR
jgi:hypothetical protein